MREKPESERSLAHWLNPETAGRFQALKHEVLGLVKGATQEGDFLLYTDHYAGHAERVVELTDRLIPPQVRTQLNNTEIFVLLCAAYLHDIGMSVFPTAASPEVVRERHGALSMQVIDEHRTELPLTSVEANAVGALSLAHTHADLSRVPQEENIGANEVRMRFLAALLRLADALDIDYARMPPLPSRGADIPAEVRHRLRMSRGVSRIDLRPEEQRIVLRIAPSIDVEPDKVVFWATKKAQEIKKCLEESSAALEANGISYKDVKVVLESPPSPSIAARQLDGKDD